MTVCEMIERQFSGLFTCSEINSHVRIRTPYLYPDGDVIDLFYQQNNDGGAILTDLGETTRWLRSQTASARKSFKQKQLILDICAASGIEFFKGALVTRIAHGENLALKTTELAQAALRVADIWITFRTRATLSFADEVAEYLEERSVKYDRNEKLSGRSGRPYTVDFHTFTPNRSAYIDVLSTGSKPFARVLAEHTFTAWSDLSYLKTESGIRFVTLFDDSFDVWTPEDERLLSGLSDTIIWSKPEELYDALASQAA